MSKILKSKKFLTICFCFLISFVVLLFTSKCSPLYPFNDWVDANAFFTVGKSMMNGVIPYRDLFEQKGLFLYFIYGIGYLFSNTTFIGVFVLEILFFTVFLYYVFKIFTLFVKAHYALLSIPVIASLLCISTAFVHGGGAEEFCLPFLAISLYYFLSHFKKQELKLSHFFLNGFIAGIILMTKYTLLGFWFAFMATLFLDLVLEKKWKKAMLESFVFLGGMALPFGISLLYLGLNHGIKDFFHTYFYINMTAYGEMTMGPIERIFAIIKGFITSLKNNNIILCMSVLLAPISIFFLPLKKSGKIYFVFLYLFSLLGIFYGLKFYPYYIFPMLFFCIIFLIAGCYYVEKWFDKHMGKPVNYILIISATLLSFMIAYERANYKEFRNVKKEDLFQYQFADIIKKEKNPTMVNMGYLDAGVYTTTGIIPSTYFFERQNFNYKRFPDNIDAFHEYIKKKETMFIVYYTGMDLKNMKKKEKELFKNYDMIKMKHQEFERVSMWAYLFKVKE